MKLTPASKTLLVEIVKDLPNWGPEILSGGNVEIGPERRGNLSDLVKKGLVRVFESDGYTWIQPTSLGIEMANS